MDTNPPFASVMDADAHYDSTTRRLQAGAARRLVRICLPMNNLSVVHQPPRTLKFGPKFSFNNGWANCFADSTMDTAAWVETDLGPGLPTVLLEREYVLPSPEWSTLYRVLALDA